MPLAAVNCCQGAVVTPEECVAHACTRQNDCNYTAEVLAAMYDTVQNRGERITTTALLAKCLRQEMLSRTEDYAIEPRSLWASFRGTMFHGRLEQYAQPGTVAEPRFYAELDGLGELTGSPDLVDVPKGILYDYKNTGSPPRFGRPWDNHTQQNNINRWLVDNGHSVEVPSIPLGLTEDQSYRRPGHDGYFFDLTVPEVRDVFVPVDWQALVVFYLNDDGPAPMECTKSIQVPKVSGEGTKARRVPDIWDDEYAEAFIRERYAVTQTALVEHELPPIPPGFEGQAHVLCNYCPHRARCRELEISDLLTTAA